jgi:hypothetical protein
MGDLAAAADHHRGQGRIFPHHHESISTAFTRACVELKIDDLHFHDLRHEGTSRLFEAGLSIEKVALVTGHKDWRMLQRYTNLKPEDLHRLQKASQPSMEEFIEILAASWRTFAFRAQDSDCLSGFQGNKVRVERQMPRLLRPTSRSIGDASRPCTRCSCR